MKKRMLSLLLVMSVIFTFFTLPASANETKADYTNAVYLGIKDYGTVESDAKADFIHRFYISGEEKEFTIECDDSYTLQNRLQEGYVFDLCVKDGKITDVTASKADAEGKITAAKGASITVDGKNFTVGSVYEISNTQAGATAVAKKGTKDLTVGETVKVYGDTAFLAFVAEPYTAPVSGTPGVKTLKNYLQTAMNPVGTALYVYGGAWDWQDVNSSNQALTIGLPQSWVDFFQQQDIDFSYKNSDDAAHSYYPHNSWNQYYYAGVDCSAYIGWTVYNVMNTESTTNDATNGYVMSAVKMAKTFADNGWGTFTREISEFKPGDVFSMSGHVWTVVGVCDDGSIVFLHSTPSDNRAGTGLGGGGVQLSALNPNDDDNRDCEAYELVTKYMAKYYPEWNERYEPVLRSFESYATPATGSEYRETWSGNFSWTIGEKGLTDPDGYADMSAAEILADLFGESEYDDVKTNEWYYEAVQYVTEKGLMAGTDKGFEPNTNTSRAMIWTILARLSGETVSGTGSKWYADAQAWAVKNGVSDGTDPNGNITREQLAAMLYRYAQANGLDVSVGEDTNILSYADATSVSEYAVSAMQWACGAGIINGMDGKLAPQGYAQRAQVATMLMRYAALL